MADRNQSQAEKTATDQRQQGQRTGQRNMPNERMRGAVGQKHGVVGNDIPDESKERHTEIAVEAGRKLSKEQAKH